ncbi:hypothetical protein CR513_06346, partial [Mucuna pruriens]
MLDSLSRRHALIAMLETKMFYLDCIKELYEDIDFSKTYAMLYLELQTSKLENIGSPRKLRQRSTTYLFRAQHDSTIYNSKRPREVAASASNLLGYSSEARNRKKSIP